MQIEMSRSKQKKFERAMRRIRGLFFFIASKLVFIYNTFFFLIFDDGQNEKTKNELKNNKYAWSTSRKKRKVENN